jgi:hypothetical protein
MPFTEGALREALLTETQRENNGQLICQDIALYPTHNLPMIPVFWSTCSIVAAVLNCLPKQITPIMCISAHKGNRFGVTIETTHSQTMHYFRKMLLNSQPRQRLHLDHTPDTKTHIERRPASPRSTGQNLQPRWHPQKCPNSQ